MDVFTLVLARVARFKSSIYIVEYSTIVPSRSTIEKCDVMFLYLTISLVNAAQLTADGSSAFKGVLAKFAPSVVPGWNYLAGGSGAGMRFLRLFMHMAPGVVCTLHN